MRPGERAARRGFRPGVPERLVSRPGQARLERLGAEGREPSRPAGEQPPPISPRLPDRVVRRLPVEGAQEEPSHALR